MQTKSKIALGAAAIAGLAGIIGLAQFANADRGGWGGHGGRGHGMMMNMAERYDTNKDGSISQEEIDANRTATHGEFDADKNNALTLKEFEGLWLKARNQMMVREFQRFDRDGDGNLTLEEYQTPMKDMVARMDQNGDKVLNMDDHKQMRMGHGKRRMHGGGPEGPAEEGGEQ
jgi:Ca2+-binding EF-hand superfamily protein